MSQPLPRAFRRQLKAEDEAKVDRLVRDADASEGATAGGAWERLRGLPAIGRGCAGHIRGSQPLQALIAKESRRQG